MPDNRKSVLRLPKRHRGATDQAHAVDGTQLIREQSLRNAIFGGLIVIILFSGLWAMLSTLVDKVFPWMTVVLGVLVGVVIRRAGRGLDWRFPALAAVMVLFGALLGNVVVAAAFTAAEFETSTFAILRAVTLMTWPVFFDEVIAPGDFVYAFFGAATAAFYANRRLSRGEYNAVRRWREEQVRGGHD